MARCDRGRGGRRSRQCFLQPEERLANMEKRVHGFVPFLKRAVEAIPDGTPVTEIRLADWECLDWDNHNGLITLAGDAAHVMTMCKSTVSWCSLDYRMLTDGILDRPRRSCRSWSAGRLLFGSSNREDLFRDKHAAGSDRSIRERDERAYPTGRIVESPSLSRCARLGSFE